MKGVGRKNVLDVRYLLPTFLTVFIISVCQGFTINSKMNKNHSMGITPGQKCKFKIARERTVWRGWLVLVNATALSFTPVWSSSTEPASDKASEVSLVMTKVSVQNSGKCIFYIILVISHSTPVTTATYQDVCGTDSSVTADLLRVQPVTHHLYISITCELIVNLICGPNPESNAIVSCLSLIHFSPNVLQNLRAWDFNLSSISPCMNKVH